MIKADNKSTVCGAYIFDDRLKEKFHIDLGS